MSVSEAEMSRLMDLAREEGKLQEREWLMSALTNADFDLEVRALTVDPASDSPDAELYKQPGYVAGARGMIKAMVVMLTVRTIAEVGDAQREGN